MLHNQRDEESQRTQMRAIFWMSLFMLAWLYFFMPKPEQQQPPSENAPAPVEPTVALDSKLAPPTPMDWPDLPPAAETSNPEEDEVKLATDKIVLVFTRIGARLKRADIVLGDHGDGTQQLVPEAPPDVPDASAMYPLGLKFSDDFLGNALDTRRWEAAVGDSGRSVKFTLELSRARIEKTFTLDPEMQYVVDMSVAYTNLEDKPRVLGLVNKEPAYSVYWGPNVDSGDKSRYVQQELIWRVDGASEHHRTMAWKPKPESGKVDYPTHVLDPEWGAIKSAYFVVALKPEKGEDAGEWTGWSDGNEDSFRMGLGVPRFEVESGKTNTQEFRLYLGPRLTSAMSQAWPGLDVLHEIFDFWGLKSIAGFMNWFATIMLSMMNWFHAHVIANYGMAIIFVTLVVRGGMFPLTLKSMKSMKRMQKLAPEVQQIRDEFKDNPQEAQKRSMELYKERGVNPLGGCFPIMLQMPVFIAFYRMLSNAFELRGASFLWIHDLSGPDRFWDLPFVIPVPFMTSGIDALNLLPILMAIAMVVSQKLMPASGPAMNPQQKLMMTLMPVIFSVVCYNMPAGLNLYILTSTVLGIGQNYLVHVNSDEVKAKKKRPANRPKHFYAAAQMKKKEMAREARREKKKRQKH